MVLRLIPAVLILIISCSLLAQTYTISTFAGGGLPQNATELEGNLGTVDRAGNVFITSNHAVWQLDSATGLLTRVAGSGTQGYTGDNGRLLALSFVIPAALRWTVRETYI